MSANVTHERGDLFQIAERDTLRTWALVHCISEDCAMGKGIAVEFKKRFGGVDELRKQVAAGKKTGKAAKLLRDGRIVFYLITKKAYYNKPTYSSIESALVDMANEMVERGVDGCIMPRIGCGLDRLLWPQVEQIVGRVFGERNLSAIVCSIHDGNT